MTPYLQTLFVQLNSHDLLFRKYLLFEFDNFLRDYIATYSFVVTSVYDSFNSNFHFNSVSFCLLWSSLLIKNKKKHAYTINFRLIFMYSYRQCDNVFGHNTDTLFTNLKRLDNTMWNITKHIKINFYSNDNSERVHNI